MTTCALRTRQACELVHGPENALDATLLATDAVDYYHVGPNVPTGYSSYVNVTVQESFYEPTAAFPL